MQQPTWRGTPFAELVRTWIRYQRARLAWSVPILTFCAVMFYINLRIN
ncbi:hypothetical protein M2284_002842 [Rhodococcus sp. LBL1]|uniref:ABC transporter permease n=1 Tax=Prescottella agglutinans TaxID=1644129 RepID=A0ABT6M9U9_9NOCA|nr:hypothetical protein [Prescottella agglutinans]MDH6281083.1 hypothetical protein [Prescottella agglutinans]MDH6678629.1 hypothetical protein [Rhodococcus sp. LBL1]MDH6684493.1 hypothetical protein [Rhodococcus sp. LBL2]